MHYSDYFKGKKITVMGLDPRGRGVQDVAFLSEHGAIITATDLKSEAELFEGLSVLKGYSRITYVLGEHRVEDFENKDLIIRAASVPLISKYIEYAEVHNIPIETDETLFLKLAPKVTTVGVTGTRGKSTVVHLIHHILKMNGKRSFLAGNVRGVASLPLLEEVKENDVIIFELDSWKLQQFGNNKINLNISVFTSFYPDHMNYYKGDMQTYFDDKANIFKYQKRDDMLIMSPQAHTEIEKYYKKDFVGKNVVVKAVPIKNKYLRGKHNEYNVACALSVAVALGISPDAAFKSILTFKGVEGRLQYVRQIHGVSIYNDNNATTPDATIAGLQALGKNKNIVLIMGGSDKGLDMSALISEIPKQCKGVVLFKEDGTDRIREAVLNLSDVEVIEKENLKDCVSVAMNVAKQGDIVLYSPAFASFGKYFKNEYDRNDQFLKIIEEL